MRQNLAVAEPGIFPWEQNFWVWRTDPTVESRGEAPVGVLDEAPRSDFMIITCKILATR